jgi:hypothetical protein
MRSHSLLTIALVVAAGACSDSADSTADASAPAADAAAVTDAPVSADAGDSADAAVDAGQTDAAPADAGFDGDGAALCHGLGFGAPTVTIQQVGSLPAMTGGTIELGTYDAIAVQITSSITGLYRGTWQFDGASTMKIIEQIGLNGATPPEPLPKNLTWSTAATNLMRQQTCGGTSSFTNGYTVRSDGGDTLLDVRSGSILFTFKKRP